MNSDGDLPQEVLGRRSAYRWAGFFYIKGQSIFLAGAAEPDQHLPPDDCWHSVRRDPPRLEQTVELLEHDLQDSTVRMVPGVLLEHNSAQCLAVTWERLAAKYYENNVVLLLNTSNHAM